MWRSSIAKKKLMEGLIKQREKDSWNTRLYKANSPLALRSKRQGRIQMDRQGVLVMKWVIRRWKFKNK